MGSNRDRVLELAADGVLDAPQLIRDLLCWMSEDEVEEFCKFAGIELGECEDEDEDNEPAEFTLEDVGYKFDDETDMPERDQ